MNKKGLTLIETMAVIVIVGILSLILVPMINDIITSSRKKAFKETVNNILESSHIYEAGYTLENGQELEYPVVLTCNGETCEDADGKPIDFKGPVPISGRIILESVELMRADLISNGQFCGSGTKGNIEVHENCSMLDHTNPLINELLLDDVAISSTTNSIIVSIPEGLMYDDETGIDRYEITIYEGSNQLETKIYEDPNVVFNGLKNNTEYKVEITGINGNKLKTTIEKNVTTLDISNPVIAYNNTPSVPVNGYLLTQTLSIEYAGTNIENPTYYLRSTRNAKANVIASCGNGTIPSECTNNELTIIEANVWYKVSGNTDVTYDEDTSTVDSLTAVTHDGINYSGASTKTVAMIDGEKPVVTLGTKSSTSNAIIVNYTLSDEKSGIVDYICKYSDVAGSYTISSNSVTSSNCVLTNLTNDKTYYYEVCAIDGVGNVSDCKNDSTATSEIIQPTCTYVNNPTSAPNSKGYFHSQVIKCEFNDTNITSAKYFIKTTRSGKASAKTVEACGSGAVPTSCSSAATKNLDANTWYRVSGNINVTYSADSNDENLLTAVTYDGDNYSASTTKTIAKIEANDPTAPTITGGSNDWTNSSRTISVSTEGQASSGIAKYQYYISTSSTSQSGGSWNDVSGTSQEISTEGTHYIFFRTVSEAGYISGASNAQTVKIETDRTAPTITGGSNSWTNGSRTISVSKAGTATSEVAKYQYYISTSSSSRKGGSWKDVSGTSQEISTEGTHYIFFRTVSNAGYTSAVSNAQTVKIETTRTAPTITGGSNDWTNSSRTISVSKAGTATTGVAKYQYYISTSSTSQSGGSWNDVSGTSQTVSTEGTNYVFFRTVSEAGFASDASSAQVVKVDTTGPTKPTSGSIAELSNEIKTGTINAASGSNDSGVGGITYKYMVTNSSTAPGKNDSGFTTSRNFSRSCSKKYYAYAIAEDSLGNRSDVKSLGSANELTCVCVANNTDFASLQSAIDSSVSNNKTIILKRDIDTDIIIPSGKTVDINFEYYKVTGCAINAGTLTIRGSNDSGIICKKMNTAAMLNRGTLTMQGASITQYYGASSAQGIYNEGTFNMTGGTITGGNAVVFAGSSSGTIKDVTIKSSSSVDSAVVLADSSNINLEYTTITNTISGKNGLINNGSGVVRARNINVTNNSIVGGPGKIIWIETNNSGFITRYNGAWSVGYLFPTWSANGGQDDITWNCVKSRTSILGTDWYVQESTWAEHKNDTGEYAVHIYRSTIDCGSIDGEASTSFVR